MESEEAMNISQISEISQNSNIPQLDDTEGQETQEDEDQYLNVVSEYRTGDGYFFKVILVGDSGVGKTNVLRRYTHNEFFQYMPTIGVEFGLAKMVVDGKRVVANCWDLPGQERFRAVNMTFYHGASGVLLVYDITNRVTFENLKTWMKEVCDGAHSDAVIMLVGNKSDIVGKRVVPEDEGRQLAEENDMLFMETSALESTNVDMVFQTLLTKMYYVALDRQEETVTNTGLLLNLVETVRTVGRNMGHKIHGAVGNIKSSN